MTHISFTSGEILDIISALEDKAETCNDAHLSAYYLNMIQQFESITDKLNQLPGENRVANLVLAMN